MGGAPEAGNQPDPGAAIRLMSRSGRLNGSRSRGGGDARVGRFTC